MRGETVEAGAGAGRSFAALAAVSANSAWEVDREWMLVKSERRAWRVALVALGIAVLSIGVDFTRGALRQLVPIAIVVDKATGETSVQLPLSASSVPLEDALDKHFAVQFVTAREEYDWSWLSRDYNTVARLAEPAVFAPYAAQFHGQKGQNLTDRLSDRVQWRLTIVGVRFPPATPSMPTSGATSAYALPGARVREAFVTFDRQAYDLRERAKVGEAQRFVASLRFEYRPRLAQTDAERIENPLGFVVTAYRTDAEFAGAASAADEKTTVDAAAGSTAKSAAASAPAVDGTRPSAEERSAK